MSKKIFSSGVLLSVVALLCLPLATQAATFKGEENLVVNEETADLYAAGANVSILKSVTGDLSVVGSMVTIQPGVAISQDLNVAGGQLWLDAQVADDARVMGGVVNLNGQVDGDLFVAGGTVLVTGLVKGDIYAAGGTISLGGKVEGKVVLSGGEIILSDGAEIKGDFEYTSENPAQIDAAAKIGGNTIFHQTVPADHNWQPEGMWSFLGLAGLAGGIAAPLIFLMGLVALFLFTLFVIFAAPLKTQDSATAIRQHPWKSLGFGLVFLILPPIVGFILLVIPFTFMIGLVILVGYAFGLMVLPAILTFFLGSSTFRLLHRQADFTRRSHLVWSALLGALVYSLLMFIPLVGGLIIAIGLVFAAGSMLQVVRPLVFKKRDWNKNSPAVPNN